MEIITKESYIQGKDRDQDLCEDGLLIEKDFVAVVDGVTSTGDVLFNGMRSGRFARNVILERLKEINLAEFGSIGLMKDLTKCIQQKTKEIYPDLEHKYYPRASFIIFNRIKGEIWNYGDCQCMVSGILMNHDKYVDKLNAEIRAFQIECALKNGMTLHEIMEKDIGRNEIMENLKKKYMFENQNGPYGYPVLNGYSFNPAMLRTYKIYEGTEIVLASDGYPYLKDSLQESEECLRELLISDPLCYKKYKSTKGIRYGNYSFDDRTYWRGTY